MRQRIRSHVTYANVTATLALFLVLSGGTAAALSGSNSVFSDDIANDTFSSPTEGVGGLVAADLRSGSVGTSEVANGSIASADLAPAARGARAYGRVSSLGVLSRSKNVVSVTSPETGIHCIKFAASIDPSTAVLIVGQDFSNTGTIPAVDNASVVGWDAFGIGCPSGTFSVQTYLYNGDSTDDNDGSGTSTGDDLFARNESFAFAVP